MRDIVGPWEAHSRAARTETATVRVAMSALCNESDVEGIKNSYKTLVSQSVYFLLSAGRARCITLQCRFYFVYIFFFFGSGRVSRSVALVCWWTSLREHRMRLSFIFLLLISTLCDNQSASDVSPGIAKLNRRPRLNGFMWTFGEKFRSL